MVLSVNGGGASYIRHRSVVDGSHHLMALNHGLNALQVNHSHWHLVIVLPTKLTGLYQHGGNLGYGGNALLGF